MGWLLPDLQALLQGNIRAVWLNICAWTTGNNYLHGTAWIHYPDQFSKASCIHHNRLRNHLRDRIVGSKLRSECGPPVGVLQVHQHRLVVPKEQETPTKQST